MAKYYTNEPDFKEGSKTGWFHSNINCVKDLLRDIDEVSNKVNSEGLAHLYVATGEATLGRDMPVGPFEDAEHHALHRLDASKKVHKEIVQNIDGKFFEGLDNALESLNKVNEGKNQYKSKYLTYTKTNTAYDEYGTAIEYTTTEHYSISDIVNSDKTPIPAAKELYDVKLKLAKEGLAKIEKEDHENYEKLKGLSDQQLMEAMFPTQVGEYERARSTWKENNKGWLQWVEIGGKIIAVGAIIAGSVLSGGTLAPILIGAGTAYLVADSGYQAISGETISGKRLTDGERIWAGVDAVLTAATGGFATYASVLAKTGKAASTTVQTVGKAVNYADDANDIAHTVTAMQDDPLGAALQFGIGRAIGHGATALGNKARARFGKGGSGADVDLPSSGKGVDLPAGNAGLKTHADTDVDPSTLGTGKKPKPEIQTPQHQEIPSPSKKPELDVTKTSKPEIDRASSPEITGPNKKPEIDTTKTAKPEIDNPSRPAVDKTNSELDTGKPVKPEVSQARPSEVVSPNSRPKEVDVTKKPDIEVTRPAEVNPTKVKPEMETKVKPDIDAAAASASAVPKVKAQEPDLPKAGQPEVTPDAGKKVQKPEEVDTEATKAGNNGETSGLKTKFESKVQEIRQSMPNSALRNRGNMAIADVQIEGLKSEFVAHSRIHSDTSKGADVADFSMSKEDKIFTTYVEDKFPRFNDTEAKILEDIASQITDPQIKGKITLFTELPPCDSCSNIIEEFKRMFPNIQVDVLWK